MKRKLVIVVPLMLGLSGMSLAQEDLGQINVTASRVEAKSSMSSKPVTVIDRKAIEDSHAENVVDVLKGQANIVVRDTSATGAKAIVDLGGYGDTAASNKVVLIDGRRVSNPDLAEVDWTQIPLDQIERIEIVHGGGSVLYGDGAVGGVINIITRVPESGGEAGVEAGSFGSNHGHARLGADTGKVRLAATYSGGKTDGYRDNSKLERYDAGASFEADISDHIQWYGSGNQHRDRFGLPGALSPSLAAANRKQTTRPDDFGNTQDAFINSGILVNWEGFELDVPASFRRRESLAHFGGTFPFDSKSLLRTKSFRPKLNWQADVPGWAIGLVAGLDMDQVEGSVAGLNASRDRTGYYGMMSFNDADGRYTLSAGLRSEKVADALTDGTSSVSDSLMAYDVGASVSLGRFHVRLNHNRSVRFPKLDERIQYGALPPFAPSFRTDLLPQTGRHYNASVRYDADRQWVEISFQQADLNHEIYLDPTIGFFGTNSNYKNPTRHQVLMIAAAWKANDLLQLSGNYTYTRAGFRGGAFDGNSIPGVPRNRLGLQWKADWTSGFSTTLSATYVGSSYLLNDQPNVLAPLDAYWLVDIAGAYRIGAFEMFARIDNATNRKYVTTGAVSPSSGSIGLYPAAEVSIRGGVNYRF